MASNEYSPSDEFVDIQLDEDEISANILFDKFVSIKNDHPIYKDIDFNYFRNAKIKGIGQTNIQMFNELFIHCRRIEEIEIFPVLAIIAERYIESSKLKALISNELKWEIIEELKLNGTFSDFMEHTTLEEFI